MIEFKWAYVLAAEVCNRKLALVWPGTELISTYLDMHQGNIIAIVSSINNIDSGFNKIIF